MMQHMTRIYMTSRNLVIKAFSSNFIPINPVIHLMNQAVTFGLGKFTDRRCRHSDNIKLDFPFITDLQCTGFFVCFFFLRKEIFLTYTSSLEVFRIHSLSKCNAYVYKNLTAVNVSLAFALKLHYIKPFKIRYIKHVQRSIYLRHTSPFFYL